jgi:hypothetical protein
VGTKTGKTKRVNVAFLNLEIYYLLVSFLTGLVVTAQIA